MWRDVAEVVSLLHMMLRGESRRERLAQMRVAEYNKFYPVPHDSLEKSSFELLGVDLVLGSMARNSFE